VKRNAISLFCAAAIVFFAIARAWAGMGPSLTGTWKIEQTGPNGTSDSQITISQAGDGIVGKNAANGNGFTGTFVTAEKINGKWNGPGGAGWLTVYVSPNGHSFNGTWGYNGRAANGSFVGNKVLPPSPITAVGTWTIVGAGGPVMFVSPMKCTQSGPTVVCSTGAVNVQGKFRATDKVRGTWSGPNGASGWVSFWFNGDNNSFNGIWGRGTDTSKPVGRMVGQRQL
jgi:hypothetical protein